MLITVFGGVLSGCLIFLKTQGRKTNKRVFYVKAGEYVSGE